LCLDAAEALEFFGLHRDVNLAAKADLASSPLDERYTVGVERFVDRSDTRLGAGERDTGTGGGLASDLGFVTSTKGLDDGGLHRELDPVERDEPDDVLKRLW
jgi:hypothetical protein